MYEEYFGLSGAPFRLNPDPKFFFGSRSHNKAMAYLHYGVRQAEGFIVITGEVGAGKSILIAHLLGQLNSSSVVAAHLLTSSLNPDDVLGHILSAFRIEPQRSGKSGELEAFEDFLYDQMNRGRRVLLIVDEAQNLPQRTLEELRMLSNLDYEGTPLFQVFLVGQPEFREILAAADVEQLRQRVIASYHLEPLDERDTRRYIQHRLAVVGWREDPLITDDAFGLIYKESGGVPRRINTLCNRLFLHCALEKIHEIDSIEVAAVARELQSEGFGGASVSARSGPAQQARKKAPAVENVEDVAEENRKAAGGGNVVFAFSPDHAERSVEENAGAGQSAEVDTPGREEVAAENHTIWGSEDAPEFRAAGLSEFDRLRALRASAPPESGEDPEAPPRHPATLRDVASAIAAAESEPPPPEDNETEDLVAPPRKTDFRDWRRAALKSVGETREDLKTAHEGIVRMRAALAGIENRRRESRQKITANLERAENILSELRGLWR